MKKKTLIILGVILIVLVGVGFYFLAMLANFVINNINLGYNIDINCISYIL
ncbi:hypothetical protein [Clostridium perfringens]|uniref:hypothetical protein n=1 Tax=Clostridium perfringens TaxID=1502 RepID=UPI0029401882|nr:hypothetical protein [Clostridium perfringens]MDV5111659.1 hypothetical protein [Clostridium perfringens]